MIENITSSQQILAESWTSNGFVSRNSQMLSNLKEAGYMVVPIKPTDEMVSVAGDYMRLCKEEDCSRTANLVWDTMIKASEAI